MLILIQYDASKDAFVVSRVSEGHRKKVLHKLSKLYAKGKTNLSRLERVKLQALRTALDGYKIVEEDFVLPDKPLSLEEVRKL